jgi:tRNA(fMet)-specific endonuclease VapC
MPYLLDTNILIAAIKGQPDVAEKLAGIAASDILLSSIVLGELEFGVEKSAYPERNRARIFEIASKIELVGINANTSSHYGKVRAALEKAGTPIGANDTWIAAQAMAESLTLVTDNLREFSRVNGLKIENWLNR